MFYYNYHFTTLNFDKNLQHVSPIYCRIVDGHLGYHDVVFKNGPSVSFQLCLLSGLLTFLASLFQGHCYAHGVTGSRWF